MESSAPQLVLPVDAPPQPQFRIIADQFRQITGLELAPRRTNLIEARVDRQDLLFHHLADVMFERPDAIRLLQRALPGWLSRCPCETLRALAGYVAYCLEDYPRAVPAFLAAIAMNPRNLDTWIDLAFTLNHMGDPLGLELLFDHALYVEAFSQQAAPVCTLARLRALGETFAAQSTTYRHAWRDALDGVVWRLGTAPPRPGDLAGAR